MINNIIMASGGNNISSDLTIINTPDFCSSSYNVAGIDGYSAGIDSIRKVLVDSMGNRYLIGQGYTSSNETTSTRAAVVIYKISTDGIILNTAAFDGQPDGLYFKDAVLSPDTTKLYVLVKKSYQNGIYNHPVILKLSSDTLNNIWSREYILLIGSIVQAPSALTIDSQENLYIQTSVISTTEILEKFIYLLKISSDNAVLGLYGTGINNTVIPHFITHDAGYLYKVYRRRDLVGGIYIEKWSDTVPPITATQQYSYIVNMLDGTNILNPVVISTTSDLVIGVNSSGTGGTPNRGAFIFKISKSQGTLSDTTLISSIVSSEWVITRAMLKKDGNLYLLLSVGSRLVYLKINDTTKAILVLKEVYCHDNTSFTFNPTGISENAGIVQLYGSILNNQLGTYNSFILSIPDSYQDINILLYTKMYSVPVYITNYNGITISSSSSIYSLWNGQGNNSFGGGIEDIQASTSYPNQVGLKKDVYVIS